MSARLTTDRRLAVSLAAILAFGILRVIVASPQGFISPEGTLAAAYLTFVGPGQATALYVPLFAICVSGLIGRSLASCSISRNSSRLATLRCVVLRVAHVALAFALAVFVPSLVALALKSGISASAGSWAHCLDCSASDRVRCLDIGLCGRLRRSRHVHRDSC